MTVSQGPLRGLTVIDFGHWWAGPMAARILGGLGARVWKVESPGRMDPMRFPSDTDVLERYPGRDPGDDPVNRNAFFNTQNVDKSSVVLDIRADAGRAAFRRMVGQADVFIANYRPGVLARLGVDSATLRSWNDQLIVVDMPGYGASGALAGMPAYGAQFDAASGAAWAVGGAEEPLLTGYAVADATSGIMTAGAVLTALRGRSRSGQGAHVEVASRDAMMPTLGEDILAESLGSAPSRGRNGEHGAAPHDLYRTASGWLAIAVRTDEQWQTLCDVLDIPTRDREAYAEADARECNVEELRALIERRLVLVRDPAGLSGRLQRSGVAAGIMTDGETLSRDPQLRHAEYFASLAHASVGAHDYPGLPMIIDGVRASNRSSAPVLGQHTRAVLRSVGLTDADVDALVAAGVAAEADRRR